MADRMELQRLRDAVAKTARRVRLQAGLTQADVAELMGVATEVYGRLERGLLMPSVPSLVRRCLTLGVSSDELLGLRADLVPRVSRPLEPRAPPPLRRLLRTLRELTPSQLRTVAQVARAIRQER